MIRRKFIRQITVAGTGGLATAGTAAARDRRTVTYRVKGFSCVTCAVGLETILRRERGVTNAQASYPKAVVTIEYDPALISEPSLKALIAETGFSVET
jgi:copper chaperone